MLKLFPNISDITVCLAMLGLKSKSKRNYPPRVSPPIF